jgi:hypothetical protein
MKKTVVCTNDDAAAVLAQHPKSAPVETHKGMEGQRTGLPHVTPHSLRYRQAHEKFGTAIPKDEAI